MYTNDIVRVLVLGMIVRSAWFITLPSSNGTAELLWTLSGLALRSQQNSLNLQKNSINASLNSQINTRDVSNSIENDFADANSRQNYPANYNTNQQYQNNLYNNYRPNPYNQQNHQPTGGYQKYPNANPNQGFTNYPQRYPPPFQPPYRPPGPGGYPNFPGPGPQPSFMNALGSIAQYDDLHCVPRLLCELTSGGSPGVNRAPSFLPSFINMDSLLEILQAFDGAQANPLLIFGRAALLGYNARGNARSCTYAYPKCPRDPDGLVEYLNNHNGGFFRFFNGMYPNMQNPYQQGTAAGGGGGYPPYPPYHGYPQNTRYPPNNQGYPINQQYPNYPVQQNYQLQRPYNQNSGQFGQQQYPSGGGNRYQYNQGKAVAQQRILTKPGPFVGQSNNYNTLQENYWKFPTHQGPKSIVTFDKYSTSSGTRNSKRLTFPEKQYESSGNQKGTPNQYNQILEFPKPLPNQNVIPTIFPDRTGTGDLLLDTEKFSFGPDVRPYSDRISNTKNFRGNNWTPDLNLSGDKRNSKLFRFPSLREGKTYND